MAENVGSIEYTIDAKTGDAVNELKRVESQNASLGRSFGDLDKSVDSTTAKMDGLKKKADTTGRSINGMSGNFGQAGIQVQQFVGQIQGGQDALLALSQQAADVGIVMGAPLIGTLVAVGASIAGIAINAMSTTGALEEFIERLSELENKDLSKLVGQQQATAVSELNKQIDLTNSKLEEEIDKIEQLTRKESELEKKRDEARSKGFAGAVETAGINATRKAIEASLIAISDYESELESNNEKLGILNGTISANKEEIEEQLSALELAAGAFGKAGVSLVEYNKQVTISKLESQGATEAEIAKATAIFDAMIITQQAADDAKNKALADREAAAAARERAKAERESSAASKAFIEGFGLSGESDMFEDNPDSQATGISRAIIQENMTLMEQLENQRGMIQLYQELEVGDAEAHAEALIAIDKKIANEKRKNEQAMLSASSDFFGASADLVSAFAGEQSGAYKALFAVSKGFAIANAALQMQTAIANASAAPWPTNIPAIAQAVSLGGQIASSIASISYGGGRATGGPVNANSFYRMGEGNRPEVMQTGAGLFAVPGDKGRVFNGSQLDKIGGNGDPVINVYPMPGETANVNQNEDGSYDIVIARLANEMDSHSGAFYESLMRNTDANAKLGG